MAMTRGLELDWICRGKTEVRAELSISMDNTFLEPRFIRLLIENQDFPALHDEESLFLSLIDHFRAFWISGSFECRILQIIHVLYLSRIRFQNLIPSLG